MTMSEQRAATSDIDAPPSPQERAESAQAQAAQETAVPSAEAASEVASASQTVVEDDEAAVRTGRAADALTEEAEQEATMPLPAAEVAGPPGASAPAAAGAPALGTQQEVEVECPGCGLVAVGEAPRPTAAWFCPRCDYPLFWASPPVEEQPASRQARHRLPGTGGRRVVGAEACWYCGEQNEPDAPACFRCAATLPKPPAPVPTVPLLTQSVVRPVPVPQVSPGFIAAGFFAGAAVASSIAVWLLGG